MIDDYVNSKIGSKKRKFSTVGLCFQCFDAVSWVAGKASGL